MEEFYNKIKNMYLKRKNTDYSIMINGCWGTGKTFFIKKYLIPKEKHAVYLSLFGIDSIKDFYRELYFALLKNSFNNSFIVKLYYFFSKCFLFRIVFKLFSMLFLLLGWLWKNLILLIQLLLDSFGISFKQVIISISFKDNIDYKRAVFSINLKKYILIIDDLERSSIPVEEVLGVLNIFNEQNNVKIIIVANEREIKKNLFNNYENKLLATAFIESLKEKKDISINELDFKLEKEFGFLDQYKSIKEKLIRYTFNFENSLEDIYYTVLSFYKKEHDYFHESGAIEYELITTHFFEKYKSISNNYSYYNIRCLDFVLSSFFEIYEKVYSKLENKSSEEREKIFNDILTNLYCSSIAIFTGVNIEDYRDNSLIKSIDFKKQSGNLFSNTDYLSFDFVETFIKCADFGQTNIEKTIDLYFDNYRKVLNYDDPVYRLEKEYYLLNDFEVEELVKNVYERLKENKYDSTFYNNIIFVVSTLKYIGFKIKLLNDIVKQIKNNIVEYKYTNIGRKYVEYKKEINYYKDYSILYDQIEEFLNKTKQEEVNSSLMINDELNIEKMHDYVFSNLSLFSSNIVFLSKISKKKLFNILDSCSPKELHTFRETLGLVYTVDNIFYNKSLSDDLPILLELKEHLEVSSVRRTEKIYSNNRKYLIKDIEEYNKRFKER